MAKYSSGDYKIHLCITPIIYAKVSELQKLTGESRMNIMRTALVSKFLRVSTWLESPWLESLVKKDFQKCDYDLHRTVGLYDASIHLTIPREVFRKIEKMHEMTGYNITSIIRMALLSKLLNIRSYLDDILEAESNETKM